MSGWENIGDNKLMEKETIYSDAEMVGLPQSWQRMDAGADLIQEDRRAECTAAPSAILRPDGLPRNSEHNRPDATATDFRGTPITALRQQIAGW